MKAFIIVAQIEIEADSPEHARDILSDTLSPTGLLFSFYSINEIIVPRD